MDNDSDLIINTLMSKANPTEKRMLKALTPLIDEVLRLREERDRAAWEVHKILYASEID